jgi:hypothetical protein
MKALLLKVKWNKGQTENGTQYDYCRVTLQLPVYDGAVNEYCCYYATLSTLCKFVVDT